MPKVVEEQTRTWKWRSIAFHFKPIRSGLQQPKWILSEIIYIPWLCINIWKQNGNAVTCTETTLIRIDFTVTAAQAHIAWAKFITIIIITTRMYAYTRSGNNNFMKIKFATIQWHTKTHPHPSTSEPSRYVHTGMYWYVCDASVYGSVGINDIFSRVSETLFSCVRVLYCGLKRESVHFRIFGKHFALGWNRFKGIRFRLYNRYMKSAKSAVGIMIELLISVLCVYLRQKWVSLVTQIPCIRHLVRHTVVV